MVRIAVIMLLISVCSSQSGATSAVSSPDAACEYPPPVSCDLPDDPLDAVACGVEVSYHDVQVGCSLLIGVASIFG